MMETPMIEVKHLKKYFDTPKGLLHAVDDISFKIGKGKTMGVVGESGCGKSTLGRTIIHLLESTDGQIFLNGEDITRVDRKKMHEINEKMQIVFQDPYSSLNPRQTVEEIIKEPLKLSGRYKKRAELDEKTEELMRLVGIDERLRLAYPHELDGGRRQRVGIQKKSVHGQLPAGLNIGPAQQCPHPHEQPAEVAGLHHIVVNAWVVPLLKTLWGNVPSCHSTQLAALC